MTSRLFGDFISVAVFTIVGLAFVPIVLGISRILQTHEPNPEKLSTYECGEVPLGEPWVHFHVRYYVFALLFLLFDVETVFLYPWAVAYGKLGIFGLVEMALFISVLALGLSYAWRKGALTWR